MVIKLKKENSDYVRVEVDEPENEDEYFQQPAPQMPRVPRKSLMNDALNMIAGNPEPQNYRRAIPQQYPRPQRQQQRPNDSMISRQIAAIEVLKEVNSIKLLGMIGIVMSLIAAGAGGLAFGWFGYLPILGMTFFMWKYITATKKINYLRYCYNI